MKSHLFQIENQWYIEKRGLTQESALYLCVFSLSWRFMEDFVEKYNFKPSE